MSIRVAQGLAGSAGWATTSAQGPYISDIWSPGTVANTALTIPCAGYSTVLLTWTPLGAVTMTGGVLTYEVSDDGGGTWYNLTGIIVSSGTGVYNTIQNGSTTLVSYTVLTAMLFNVGGFTNFRVRLSTVITGAGCMTRFTVQASSVPCPFFYPSSLPTGSTLFGAVNINQIGGVAFTLGTTVLQASQVAATTNVTTTRTTTSSLSPYKTLQILLNITGGGAVTGTLQIFLQDSCDGGTTWDDLVSSNTFTFGAAVVTQRFFVNGYLATNATQGSAVSNLALSAGTVRQGPWGDRIQVVEKVSGTSGSPTGPTYTINCVAKI